MFGRVTCWSWSRDQPPSRADRGSSAVCCDVPFPELMAAMLRSVGAAASKRPWGLSARVVLLLLLLPLPPPLNSGEGRRTFPWPAPPPGTWGGPTPVPGPLLLSLRVSQEFSISLFSLPSPHLPCWLLWTPVDQRSHPTLPVGTPGLKPQSPESPPPQQLPPTPRPSFPGS